MIRAGWLVSSLERLYWTKDEFAKNLEGMKHLGTTVHVVDGSKLDRGSTVWGKTVNGAVFAIAWEWCQVKASVVAMSDPMCVLSNIMLVDDDGYVLEYGQKLIYLNTAVNRLRWQELVLPRQERYDERMAA